jgi:hypothetical protein
MSGPIFYAVPIGTPPAVCRATVCRKPIYFIKTAKGKDMPIDCDVPGGKPPTGMLPGQGVPHWGTCPESKSFKKARA